VYFNQLKHFETLKGFRKAVSINILLLNKLNNSLYKNVVINPLLQAQYATIKELAVPCNEDSIIVKINR